MLSLPPSILSMIFTNNTATPLAFGLITAKKRIFWAVNYQIVKYNLYYADSPVGRSDLIPQQASSIQRSPIKSHVKTPAMYF